MCLCVSPVMNCGLGLVCQLDCGQWLNNLLFKPIKKESMFFPFQCFVEKGMRSLFFKYSSSRQRGVHWPAETSVCLQQSCVHCNQTFSISDRELPVYVNLHLTQTSAALWPLCFFYSSRFSWTQFPTAASHFTSWSVKVTQCVQSLFDPFTLLFCYPHPPGSVLTVNSWKLEPSLMIILSKFRM